MEVHVFAAELFHEILNSKAIRRAVWIMVTEFFVVLFSVRWRISDDDYAFD